jgi:hypothetical protein
MYSITRRSRPHGRVPNAPRPGPAHPELHASVVAAPRSPAEPAFVVGVVVMAMSLRLTTSIMVGLICRYTRFARPQRLPDVRRDQPRPYFGRGRLLPESVLLTTSSLRHTITGVNHRSVVTKPSRSVIGTLSEDEQFVLIEAGKAME